MPVPAALRPNPPPPPAFGGPVWPRPPALPLLPLRIAPCLPAAFACLGGTPLDLPAAFVRGGAGRAVCLVGDDGPLPAVGVLLELMLGGGGREDEDDERAMLWWCGKTSRTGAVPNPKREPSCDDGSRRRLSLHARSSPDICDCIDCALLSSLIFIWFFKFRLPAPAPAPAVSKSKSRSEVNWASTSVAVGRPTSTCRYPDGLAVPVLLLSAACLGEPALDPLAEPSVPSGGEQ